jgi:hypothetical protein
VCKLKKRAEELRKTHEKRIQMLKPKEALANIADATTFPTTRQPILGL